MAHQAPTLTETDTCHPGLTDSFYARAVTVACIQPLNLSSFQIHTSLVRLSAYHSSPIYPHSLITIHPASPPPTDPPTRSSESDTDPTGHCIPCRKSSGTTGSYNLLIPSSSFTIKKGIPKLFTRQGDSGANVTYHNCPICSNLIYVEADAMPDHKLVKMGLVDDKAFLEELGRPGSEIYCKNMCAWEQGWEGAQRKDAA